MNVIKMKSIEVSGIKVRTKNANEMDADTARIGALWQGFGTQVAPKLSTDAKVYGVYCQYESDANGEFDVVAASDSLADTQGLESVIIQAGDYMVFSRKGELPQAVIDAWGDIWRYFSESPERERAFTTDFEFYNGNDEVDVYIALK